MNETYTNPMHRDRGLAFFRQHIAPLVKWRQCGDTRLATTEDIEAAWREWERAQKGPA